MNKEIFNSKAGIEARAILRLRLAHRFIFYMYRIASMSCIQSFPIRKPNQTQDLNPATLVTPDSIYRTHSLLDSNRLGKVTGHINVETLSNSHPVGHELERDDVDETLQAVDVAGDLDLVGLVSGELGIVLVADDDGSSAAGNDLLVGIERLGEDVVTGKDHDNGEVLVNQSKDTVLELSRHDGLAMEVGDFLDLESTLKRGGVLRATAEEQERLLVLEPLAELLDGLVELEHLLELF